MKNKVVVLASWFKLIWNFFYGVLLSQTQKLHFYVF
jgi:hypothetical protein